MSSARRTRWLWCPHGSPTMRSGPLPRWCKECSVRVGLLTGGGDVPGLNAAIRAVVKRGEGEYGHQIIGFRNGWRGVVDGLSETITRQHIRNQLSVGGTLLGTARYHPHADDGGLDAVLSTLESERIEVLIC